MTPEARHCLLEWLSDGPFDGIAEYQTSGNDIQTVRGRFSGVSAAESIEPFSHVNVSDTHDTTVVAIDDILTVWATLAPQPACLSAVALTAKPTTATGPTTVEEAYAAVNRILDAYDSTDDGDLVAECEPEDRWRLYRDLYALTGRTHPDADEAKA